MSLFQLIISVIVNNNILLAPHHAERLHDVAPSSASPPWPPSTSTPSSRGRYSNHMIDAYNCHLLTPVLYRLGCASISSSPTGNLITT
jgi:hypothetical protein